MAKQTGISWTDATWNAWIGCEKVSPGCKNCYAESFVKNRMGKKLWGPPLTTTRQVTKTLKDVGKWNKEAESEQLLRRVFTSSLSDFFEDHPVANEHRPKAWYIIKQCPWLHFQILTKRPHRIGSCLPSDWGDGYPNVWLGTSIEESDYSYRATCLNEIPAVCRFISYEPALGPLNGLNLSGIDWVIYGAESGSNRRPEDKQWARDMRDKCRGAGVAFFHKQSSAFKSGQGVELDGELIQEFPLPRGVESLDQFKTKGTVQAC
ncbi:Phage protein Gp37/Gp68 [Thalassoglobus neptunius]|uniref:Phage protein Gp37/Gp68 n=1 Tax=Thalassoglobus neptunius TaxID=1938619 RepID=A0A5C5X8B6_9PLAN|nr:DUF5131 family protein [Thalassoglobus neptunius]TWT58959.1 Phage protein Gp37/Gp68 [Thalassoglobus neptunius]